MKKSSLVMLTILLSVMVSCDNDSDSKDSVTVNYEVGQTLYFGGAYLSVKNDTTIIADKYYLEQKLLSSSKENDSTFLRFSVISYQFSNGNLDTTFDTILVSKSKYYQLQSSNTSGYFGFYKRESTKADTTKIPTLSRTQFPLHPVNLVEGETHTIYRRSGEHFLAVERTFMVEGMQTVGSYHGILTKGKHDLDAPGFVYNFKTLFDSKGKLLSEYDFGETVYTDEEGNQLGMDHLYEVFNRISKQENVLQYLQNMKVSDLTRLK